MRELLGRTARLRRLVVDGFEVYHNEGSTLDAGRKTSPRVPNLDIDFADLQRGRVEISDSEGRLLERIDRVDWRGELRSDDDRLRLITRGGRLEWPSRDAVLDRIYGDLTIEDAGVRVDNLGAAWNEGRATVSGSMGEAGVDLHAIGRNLSALEVSELVGIHLDFEAVGDIDCRVTVRGDTIGFAGDFTGQFDAWELDGVRCEAVIVDGFANFETLRGGVGGAWFDGRLEVDAREHDDTVITIVGEGRDLDLRAGLIPGVASEDLPRTAGHGWLEIVHTVRDEATRVRGRLLDGEIEIMPFDTCLVDVWADGDSLHFHDIDLRRGSVRARLVGSSDRDENFNGSLKLTVDDLRDLPAGWGWPEITGRLEGQVAVSGPIAELGVAGGVRFDQAAMGPVALSSGEASVVGERVLGEDWTISAAASGDGFGVATVPLGRYLFWTRAEAASVSVDSFRTVRGDTVSSFRGRADIGDGDAQVAIDRLSVAFAGNDWHTDRPVEATIGAGLLRVPRLRLESAQGNLAAVCDYRAADSLLSGRLQLTNFDLNLLDVFVREELRVGGRATAVVTASGRPEAPEIMVRGGLVGASFPLARVDTLGVAARFQAGVVDLDTLAVVSEFGRVGVRGSVAHPGAGVADFWRGADLDLDVQVIDGDWAFLEQFELEALERLGGRVRGDLRVTRTTDEPLVVGELDSAPFQFQWLKLDRLTGNVRAERGQLALGDLQGNQDQLRLEGRLEIPLRFDLLSEPITPEGGPFYAQLRIPAGSDLGPLVSATSAFTRFSGRGEVELIVSGPLAHPRYQGDVTLDDVGFVLRGNEEIFHDCRARGVFRNDLLIVQEVRGREGLKGEFAGAGTVTFDGLVMKTWDINFTADRFLVASIPDLRALVKTRNGRLLGVPVGPDSTLVPKFTGDVEVVKGLYTGNFAAQGGGADPTLGNVAPDWLADLRIIGPARSTRIVNNTMELDVSGDVTLVRDADGMVLHGGMTIDTGRLPVFNNTFTVVRGGLDFSRAVGVIPNVDIDAETRVRLFSQNTGTSVVERLTVHASGPASAMEIGFSSESGYPREAVERMLMGLTPYPDEQGDQSALTNASIGAGLNILEREIAREMDIFDTVEIDQIQRQEAGATGLDPLIGVGKYVGSDLYIKYAQGLNQNDRDILIEYQITNHLLLQTEIRRRIDEYQGDATYNLDLKYRFEY